MPGIEPGIEPGPLPAGTFPARVLPPRSQTAEFPRTDLCEVLRGQKTWDLCRSSPNRPLKSSLGLSCSVTDSPFSASGRQEQAGWVLSAGSPEARAEARQPPACPLESKRQCPHECRKKWGWERLGKATYLGEGAPSRARKVKAHP